MSSPKAFWEEWGQHSWQLLFEKLLVGVAASRAVIGLVLATWILSQELDENTGLVILFAIQIAVFTVAGTFLYRKGLDDSRARIFGITLLLIGNSYVWTLAAQASGLSLPKSFMPVVVITAGLRPEAFLAFLFWLVAEVFPAPTAHPRLRKLIAAGRYLSMAAAAWFALMGLMRTFFYFTKIQVAPSIQKTSLTITFIWYVILPLSGLALVAFLMKFRQLRKSEKPRALLFFIAVCGFLVLPFVWMGIETYLRSIPGIGMPKPSLFLTIFINLLLTTFPIIATYTILAHRVLDVQTIARNAARHLLARYFILLLGSIPFAFLLFFGWINRDSTIAELFSSDAAAVLVLATVFGLLAMIYRQPLLDWIDRRFFSEQYNARRVLTGLMEQVRGTRNLVELAKLLERGVDLALHLERVSLLTEHASAGRFVDPLQLLRPLDPAAQLITVVSGGREPIAADLDDPRSPFRSLPGDEKLWLVESRVEMIAPLHSLDGNLIGLLALGPKRSELPFLREDRELLAGVASAAGLVVELLRLKETLGPGVSPSATPVAVQHDSSEEMTPATAGEETAMECIACDRIYPPGSAECPHCHVDLESTSVPFVLRELYRLDARIGTGGMAVVYRAKDLKLGRAVAIKTLPKVNAEAAMRLRREARTAASVSHPGLAAIYGLETWRGVPMIITELLAGGTLADQLRQEPLGALAAIDMARTIAQALAKIHAVGILHRDVKPSNIGYTSDGDVKLLDFGIARIQHDFRQEKPDGEMITGPDGRSRIVNTASILLPRTRTGQLVGTVTYLSPEAARGEKPDPGVDLWALTVCLYEALTAENLFYGRSFQEVLGQIRDLRIPDVRKKAPACPEPLALFLAQELDLDRARRAEDGLEMATRLAQVRARILAA